MKKMFWQIIHHIAHSQFHEVSIDHIPALIIFGVPNSRHTVILTNTDEDLELTKSILNNSKEAIESLLEQIKQKEENERTRSIQPN